MMTLCRGYDAFKLHSHIVLVMIRYLIMLLVFVMEGLQSEHMSCGRSIAVPLFSLFLSFFQVSFLSMHKCRPFRRLWWDETVATVFCFPDHHTRVIFSHLFLQYPFLGYWVFIPWLKYFASVQPILHPEQDRVLTLRECARLQGFPDYYKFCGKLKERYYSSRVSYIYLGACLTKLKFIHK